MAEAAAPRARRAASSPGHDHRVVVVGAGIGGLVSALLLACRGLQVTLVEAAAEPGGKMRQVQVEGAHIDAGPTVFTMRWVFDEILADACADDDDAVVVAWRRGGAARARCRCLSHRSGPSRCR